MKILGVVLALFVGCAIIGPIFLLFYAAFFIYYWLRDSDCSCGQHSSLCRNFHGHSYPG